MFFQKKVSSEKRGPFFKSRTFVYVGDYGFFFPPFFW